jgi:antitoxin (DNA-binding transcriptional repressor) of toxin-antitoxin stability system
MKVIEQQDATRSLAEYAAEIKLGAIVVTDHGHPVAALVPLEEADMETVKLSSAPQFIRLIEQARLAARIEGGISAAEIRQRIE